MSLQVTRNIWQHSRAHGSALLLVLLAIADYANADGLAWPSLPALAARTRMSERQTRRHLARLVEMGELSLEPDAAGRPRRYRVTCPGHDLPLAHDLPLPGGEGRGEGGLQPEEPVTDDRPVVTDDRETVSDDRIPVMHDRSSMTEMRSSMTGKTVIHDRIVVIHDRPYKEIEPSMNYQIAIERKKYLSSLFLVPPNPPPLDAELRGCPGYDPVARFYAKLLEDHAGLGPEDQTYVSGQVLRVDGGQQTWPA